jgi:hypothetical protein
MKDAQVAKQVEYIKQTQQSHYGPPQLQDRTYGRMIATNDPTPHTVVTTTKTNIHKMIAADNPREIAPTPTSTHAVRAAQVITTEMVQHSTMTKRSIRFHTTTAPPKIIKYMPYNSATTPQCHADWRMYVIGRTTGQVGSAIKP